MVDFTHHVRNTNGRWIRGFVVKKSATPEEVIAVYLKWSGGRLVSLTMTPDKRVVHFVEAKQLRDGARRKERFYSRQLVREGEVPFIKRIAVAA